MINAERIADLRRQSEADLRTPMAHNRKPQQTPMRALRRRALRRWWRMHLRAWAA